jgi:hypothetical protein
MYARFNVQQEYRQAAVDTLEAEQQHPRIASSSRSGDSMYAYQDPDLAVS